MNQEPDDDTSNEYIDERFEEPPTSGKGQIVLGCVLMSLALIAGFLIFIGALVQEQGALVWLSFIPPAAMLAVAVYRSANGSGSHLLKGVLLAIGLGLLLFGLCMGISGVI